MKKPHYPHCWVCKQEGDCSNGTMFNIMFRKQPIDGAMGVGFYLCPLHYKELKDQLNANQESTNHSK